MKLLHMLLHGDCPGVPEGESPPKMRVVSVTKQGAVILYGCDACGAKVRLQQTEVQQPVRSCRTISSQNG